MNKIIGILSCLLFSVSCSENILDKVPLNTISDAVVWNDEVLMDAYLTESWANTYVFVHEVSNNIVRDGKGWFQITYPSKMGGETKTNWGNNVNTFRNGNLTINGGIF